MSEINENKASRGSVSQIILTALNSGSKYGYEICKEIEELSNGELILKLPSLYSSLRRMEEQDLIESYWKDSDIGGRRHYYSLTNKGKKIYEENKDNWELNQLIKKLPLNDGESALQHNNSYSYKNNNDNNSETISSSPIVASQENLFNLAKKQPEIKKVINENEERDNNPSFFQFDLFEQDVKLVKSNSQNTAPKVEQFENKYNELDNHLEEIEPEELQEDIEKSNPSPITRKDVFGEKNINNNAQNEHTNSNNLSMMDSDISSKQNEDTIQNNNLTEIFKQTFQNFDDKKSNDNEDKSPSPAVFSDIDNNIVEENNLLDNDIKADDLSLNHESSDNKQNISWDIDVKDNIEYKSSDEKENSDYKSIIGQLYNNSKLNDPYEQNKYQTFKEIFPTTQVIEEIKNESEANGIVSYAKESLEEQEKNRCEDVSLLLNLRSFQGIKIKKHNPFKNKTSDKKYTDINKLHMYSGWITSFLIVIETLLCLFLLKKDNHISHNQYIVYTLSFTVAMALCSVNSLANIFDRYKLIILNPNFKKGFIIRLLLFIFAIIFAFIVYSLILGFKDLWNINLLSYWLIPVLVSSNIIMYYFIFFLLFKSKKFNS